MSEEIPLVKSSPNFAAICNKCVSHDCTVSHSRRWTNTTSDAQSCHYMNDVLLVSSQKAVSTELPVVTRHLPAESRDLLTKLSSLRLWGQIHSAKSSQHSKKNKQHLTGLFAVGGSMASLECYTCSFISATPQNGSKPAGCVKSCPAS